MVPITFIQISDCHLGDTPEYEFRGVTPLVTLKKVLMNVVLEAPQFIVGSGDLSETGSMESYQLLRTALESTHLPYFLIPGNHDNIANLTRVFRGKVFIDRALTLKGWKFIFLNSVVPGHKHGEMSDATLCFLERALTRGPHKAAIFVHHHPVTAPNPLVNQYDMRNAAKLRAVIEAHADKVQLVAFGHIHQGFETKKNGVQYFCSPATSVQFSNIKDQLVLDIAAGPGYRVFHLLSNGRVESQAILLKEGV
jgi:Icc protein